MRAQPAPVGRVRRSIDAGAGLAIAVAVQVQEKLHGSLERHPLPWAAGALGLGAVLGAKGGLASGSWAMLVVLALLSWALGKSRRSRVVPLLLWFAVGGARASSVPDLAALEAPLAPHFDQSVTLVGEIVDLPARGARGIRVAMRVHSLRAGGPWQTMSVRVRVHLPAQVSPRLLAGDRLLLLQGKLRPFRDSGNPGAPRVADAIRRGGELASVHVSDPVWVTALGEAPATGHLAGRLLDHRVRVAAHLRRAMPGDHGDIAAALLVGERGGVESAWRDRFAHTGTAHLLAISGLHVGLVGLVAFRATRGLLVQIPALVERGLVLRLASAAALVPVLGYVALAGARAPAARAGVAVALALLAAGLGRRPRASNALALAALALVAVDPRTVLSLSAQLSFSAVAAMLLVALRGEVALPSPDAVGWIAQRFRSGVGLAAVAGLATAPLVAAHMGELSAIGLVANPLVVPLVATLAVPLGLVGLALLPLHGGLAEGCFRLMELPLAAGLAIVSALDGLPWGRVTIPAWPVGLAPLLTALVLLALARPGTIRRWAGTLALLGALAFSCPRAGGGALEVVFLAVGRADAAIVRLPDGAHLLVDTGVRTHDGYDSGARVVRPALAALGVKRLDLVVITHMHSDHLGGLPAVLEQLPVAELWLPHGAAIPGFARPSIESAVLGGTRVRRMASETSPRPFGGAQLAVLHPPRATGPGAESANDRSLVLWLGHGRGSLLLTGDIGIAAEDRLLASGHILRSSVLKVAHHGSRSSSGEAFLEAVSPAVAVVSAPRASPHHPHPSVLARLRDRHLDLRVTGRGGAVRLWVSRDGEVRG